jgi:hypothetical protein
MNIKLAAANKAGRRDDGCEMKELSQGLKRLRKKRLFRTEYPERIPQGLKPSLI